MRALIAQAIRERRRLTLSYDGRFCTVEPHAYGLDRNGKLVLLCYETSETGLPHAPAGWKQLRLDKASYVSDTSDCFRTPRLGYKRNDTSLVSVFAQI